MSPETETRIPDGTIPPASQLPLIRYSHIFSAAVREYLEVKLLTEAEDRMSPRQLELLRFIELEAHHIDEVAKFLGITGPAATRAIDKLERRGLVFRAPSEGDRRLRVLCCSEKGRQLVARYRSLETDRLASILTEFSETEIAALTDLLARYSLALVGTERADRVPCLRCAGYFDPDCPLQFVHSKCPFPRHREEKQ